MGTIFYLVKAAVHTFPRQKVREEKEVLLGAASMERASCIENKTSLEVGRIAETREKGLLSEQGK
ncbi:MAG: hypothetical protein QXQ66_10205 [Candidatus Hadarchaeum sp.]|uniref:hypothetical protein n=1 Tax=Candidatus Hadarchaeum sp. TaxID=2883567 RepID=UPI00317168EC